MNKLQKVTGFGPTRGFIGLLSLGLVAWGAFVANPLTDTFKSAEFYTVLEHLATEPTWGVAFILSGGVMLWGTIKRKVDVISIGAMFGFLLWAFLSLAYTLSDTYVTPIVTNLVLACIHGWAWLCVKMEPSVITNRTIWNDDEVAALQELAEFRTEKRELDELIYDINAEDKTPKVDTEDEA